MTFVSLACLARRWPEVFSSLCCVRNVVSAWTRLAEDVKSPWMLLALAQVTEVLTRITGWCPSALPPEHPPTQR